MNRRLFFQKAALFVAGCALAIRVKPLPVAEIPEMVFSQKPLVGKWRFQIGTMVLDWKFVGQDCSGQFVRLSRIVPS